MKAAVGGEDDQAFDGALQLPDPVNRRRYSRQMPQTNPSGDIGLSRTRPPRESTVEPHNQQQLSYQSIGDVKMLQDKSGRVFLLSQKPHLKLPSGTMFMLRNRPALPQGPAGAEKAANTQ
jgi:hypothetical protein